MRLENQVRKEPVQYFLPRLRRLNGLVRSSQIQRFSLSASATLMSAVGTSGGKSDHQMRHQVTPKSLRTARMSPVSDFARCVVVPDADFPR